MTRAKKTDGPSKKPATPEVRCAIYTRKSTEERLDLEYNSLDAQRDVALAYIASQRHEGWKAVDEQYDDGGFAVPMVGGIYRSSDAAAHACPG